MSKVKFEHSTDFYFFPVCAEKISNVFDNAFIE